MFISRTWCLFIFIQVFFLSFCSKWAFPTNFLDFWASNSRLLETWRYTKPILLTALIKLFNVVGYQNNIKSIHCNSWVTHNFIISSHIIHNMYISCIWVEFLWRGFPIYFPKIYKEFDFLEQCFCMEVII